ncbi:unnamed protein product [Clonostachys chloroleuca]|uniref:Uncharacterized protein n=1 Tax=Clonostachys chloroleuca TaxID=1926264 RepID=A0AA35LRM3_9HYPO|nr:unnamed protein product [Clonostachys chloroleuca]
MRFSTVLIAAAATLTVASTKESAPFLALRDAEELEKRDDADQFVDERDLDDLEVRGNSRFQPGYYKERGKLEVEAAAVAIPGDTRITAC